jgi:SAM-dependent methyltransferase
LSVDDLFARVTRRYGPCSRFTRHYVRFKLRLDPVCREVVALAWRLPLGEVADVGCGRGQLGLALLEAALADCVVGIDSDEARLYDARRASAGLRFRGEVADARRCDVPPCDTVLLIDVLYQMETETQLLLLQRATTAARVCVILRAFDPARGWRSTVNWLSEAICYRLRLKRKARVNPRPLPWLARILEQQGFAVEVRPCWRGTPFAGVLVVARRHRL